MMIVIFKKTFGIVLVFALALVACVAEQKNFLTNSLPIPGRGILQIESPAGWTFTTEPRAATIKSDSGGVAVQIVGFEDGIGPRHFKPPDEQMAVILKDVADANYAPRSIEKETKVEK